jgi:hypothetical protein
MSEFNNRLQPNKNYAYRHASSSSVQNLILRLNQRLFLHLVSLNMQPDLFLADVRKCLRVEEGLRASYLMEQIRERFNQIHNVEEAEALRDQIMDNIQKMNLYYESPLYLHGLANMDGKEKLEVEKARQASVDLFDRIYSLLFDVQIKEEEPVLQQMPKAPQDDWQKYEAAPKKEKQDLLASSFSFNEEEPEQNDLPKNNPPSQNSSSSSNNSVVQIDNSVLTRLVLIIALGFICFGGISALSSILSYQQSNMLRLFIYVCFWLLCMINLVFVFSYYSGKLLHVDIRDEKSEQASIFEQYSVLCWADLIVGLLLVFSAWFYSFSGVLDTAFLTRLFHTVPSLFLIVGTIVLLFISYRALLWLKKKTYGKNEAYVSTAQSVKNATQKIKDRYTSYQNDIFNEEDENDDSDYTDLEL